MGKFRVSSWEFGVHGHQRISGLPDVAYQTMFVSVTLSDQLGGPDYSWLRSLLSSVRTCTSRSNFRKLLHKLIAFQCFLIPTFRPRVHVSLTFETRILN